MGKRFKCQGLKSAKKKDSTEIKFDEVNDNSHIHGDKLTRVRDAMRRLSSLDFGSVRL